MRIQNLIPILFLAMSVVGCELEEEPAEALDGSQAFDVGVSSDVSMVDDMDLLDSTTGNGCGSDDECAEPGTTCFHEDAGVSGFCAECGDNTYCPMDRPFCRVDGVCHAESQGICRDPLECEDPNKPLCLTSAEESVGTCVECTGNTDCVAPRSICSTTGICVQSANEATCSEDAECGVLRQCVDGACQPN